MCKECNSIFCVSGCPNFTGVLPGLGAPRHICSSCEGGIYEGEFYYSICGEVYCEECVEYLNPQELASLLGYHDASDMIELLGGKHRRD